MTKERTIMKSIPLAFVCAATLVGLLASPGTSGAATGTHTGCTISQMGGDSGRINMTCSGVAYYAQTWGSCFTQNLDTIKMWESMLMSAYLANKKLTVYYEDGTGKAGCSNNRWINSIQVTN
jgi:hypothetical protein